PKKTATRGSCPASPPCNPRSKIQNLRSSLAPALRPLLALPPEILIPLAVLGRHVLAEVLDLEHLANLDLCVLEGGALEPLDRLHHRLPLPQPEPGDELLGLGEGSVDDGFPAPREADPLAFRARAETVRRQQHPGLQQLLVELAHFG